MDPNFASSISRLAAATAVNEHELSRSIARLSNTPTAIWLDSTHSLTQFGNILTEMAALRHPPAIVTVACESLSVLVLRTHPPQKLCKCDTRGPDKKCGLAYLQIRTWVAPLRTQTICHTETAQQELPAASSAVLSNIQGWRDRLAICSTQEAVSTVFTGMNTSLSGHLLRFYVTTPTCQWSLSLSRSVYWRARSGSSVCAGFC